MKIEAVRVRFPGRTVTNDDVLSLIRWHSSHKFRGDLARTLKLIERLLEGSGALTRQWLAPGEQPIELIKQAVADAVAAAACALSDVDLLIYVGVGKGFVEPGQSYMLAHALKMERVECFDVLDACMSWTRAMHIADGLLKTERYRRILIVNGEFNMREDGAGFPQNFGLSTVEELEWTLPSYTIGEAATATLVSPDPERPWKWAFASAPTLGDLCTIPLPGFERYCDANPRIGRNGPLRFTSYGAELHRHGGILARKLWAESMGQERGIQRVFTHSSSKTEWARGGADMGIADKVFDIYERYGNVVSAAVPAGIALASHEGLVQRGDKLAGWVASAGMSCAAFSFHF